MFVTLVRSGELTPRLFALAPGDRLWLGPKPSGHVHAARGAARAGTSSSSATGTGLAPYMSMLRTELACGGPQRIAVLAGARHSWDLGYSAELITMQRGSARTSPTCRP